MKSDGQKLCGLSEGWSAMYETHWGLRESPFRGLANPRYFYCSPTHDEALARLQFLVQHRRRLGLLLGMPGSGKSLLLEVFGRQHAECRAARSRR